jgi:hypothetical protein
MRNELCVYIKLKRPVCSSQQTTGLSYFGFKLQKATDKIGNDMSSGAELARKVVQDVSSDDLDKWVRSSTLTNEVEEVRQERASRRVITVNR